MFMPRSYRLLCWVGILVMTLLISCGGVRRLPELVTYRGQVGTREACGETCYIAPNGMLRKSTHGLWELYLTGDPLERGLTNGMLTQELLREQERIFVSQVRELVPSRFRQWLLRKFLGFFNRKLDDHVPEEYKVEIYGLSRFASNEFNDIAPPYQRLLYFHGAHDIGHALQDLVLVGCTSFAAWGTHTADGKLLIGRNFDFYAGDDFAKEKVVAFIDPDSGYRHALVTWPGMIGAVSGMNEAGLTVTINAGKSDMPFKAKTPIALLTREILQYAATIDDAVRIARGREVFVSESIMVGSAADSRAVLIEVSPKKFGVYEAPNGSNPVVCANHFQSEPYRTDKRNLRQQAESHSLYRFDRMTELIAAGPPLTPPSAVSLLREKDGVGDAKLGYGNEMAINHLLAHHAVVFQPEDRRMWVSTAPYQLGEFVAYDLDSVFNRTPSLRGDVSLALPEFNIASDPFAHSADFGNYEHFRVQMRNLEAAIATGERWTDEALGHFVALNPGLWKGSFLVGEYYYQRRRYAEALRYYRQAASREVATEPDRKLITKRIKKCESVNE